MPGEAIVKASPALGSVFVACTLAACASNGGGPGTAGAVSGTVTVFAAASLSDAFREIGQRFERRFPGTSLSFNFAGSPTLRVQIEQGARADVFASADERQMALAKSEGLLAAEPVGFAANSLVIITPASGGAVAGAADLARPGVKLLLANQDVPVGSYAREALRKLEREPGFPPGFAERTLKNLVSDESSVKQVVAKVELGEGDAGIVYRSDVSQSVAGKLRVIPIPERANVVGTYPVAVLKDGRNPAAGRAFIEFLLSSEGQEVLRQHGFLPVS